VSIANFVLCYHALQYTKWRRTQSKVIIASFIIILCRRMFLLINPLLHVLQCSSYELIEYTSCFVCAVYCCLHLITMRIRVTNRVSWSRCLSRSIEKKRKRADPLRGCVIPLWIVCSDVAYVNQLRLVKPGCLVMRLSAAVQPDSLIAIASKVKKTDTVKGIYSAAATSLMCAVAPLLLCHSLRSCSPSGQSFMKQQRSTTFQTLTYVQYNMYSASTLRGRGPSHLHLPPVLCCLLITQHNERSLSHRQGKCPVLYWSHGLYCVYVRRLSDPFRCVHGVGYRSNAGHIGSRPLLSRVALYWQIAITCALVISRQKAQNKKPVLHEIPVILTIVGLDVAVHASMRMQIWQTTQDIPHNGFTPV
jgi:hypothetical protein